MIDNQLELYPSYISSSQQDNQLNKQLDDQSTDQQINLSVKPRSRDNKNSQSETHIEEGWFNEDDTSETINIGTHNVRGINKTIEQNNLMTEIEEREIDILGISETKLHEKDVHFAFANHHIYKCYASSSTNNTYGNGVAILIKKSLAKHVSKIDKLEGRIIALHIHFKKCKMYIIIVVVQTGQMAKPQKNFLDF